MKSIFKRFLLLFAILFSLFFLVLFVVTSLFQDQIGDRVTEELNAQLKSELFLDGFELSFFRTFPNLGANLQGVSLKGTDGETLLKAEELSFKAGLFSLLGSNIKLKSVVVRDGELNIRTNSRGERNYDIFLTKDTVTSEESSSDNAIDLQQASVRNMQVHYLDGVSKQDLRLYIKNASFAGQFSSENYQLESDADIQIRQVRMDKELMLVSQTFHYEAALDVNSTSGIYKINQLDLQLGDLPLSTQGQFQVLADKTSLDLEFASNGGQLENLISLLPARYKRTLKGIESRGDFSLIAKVVGDYTDRKLPQIDAQIDFLDGRISGDRIDAKVRELGFTATYSNGDRQSDESSSLRIENLQGEIDGEAFALDLSLANFSDPQIDFSANGTLAPGLLVGFIPDERISEGSGKIHLRNIRLKGRYNDMLNTRRIGRVDMGGEIDFESAGLIINDEMVRLNTGLLRMADNQLLVEKVDFEAPGTQMSFDGEATNLLPVLFSDSLNSQDVQLQFEALLTAEELDIGQLLALGAPSEEVEEAAAAAGKSDSLAVAEVAKREFFTQFLAGTFQANIASFNYDEIEGEDFTGAVSFADGTMTIKGTTKAMDGEMELDGDMLFDATPTLNVKLSCRQISAYEFFRQAENFGQDVLVADNINGQLDARIYIEAAFDEEGNFLTDQLRVLGGLGVKDGRLKDFKMLEDFSSFVDIRDLQEIRFTNLENFFEVRDSKLFLPVMFIQSNALNLTISGEHTFDQKISYYLKVNAGQVMSDRFRRHNPKLRPKPARKNGFFNLYYAILGDIENFNFVSDKQRVTNDFYESETRKRAIHQELEQKFGTIIELVQEPLDWRDIPEYQEDPDSTEPEFLDMEIDGGGGGR